MSEHNTTDTLIEKLKLTPEQQKSISIVSQAAAAFDLNIEKA